MPHKILVVEDDAVIAALICRSVERAFDAEVVQVAGNVAALAFLLSDVPSLVITDLFHPDGRGEELVAQIRTTERLQSVPIIVQSGQLFGHLFDTRLFEHRIDAAFRKPWPMSAMLAAVARCLSGRNVEAEAHVALVRVGAESKSLDYKLTIDLDDKKQRACLAKDVIAFFNSGGGSIVVGVEEKEYGRFDPVGVPETVAQTFEVTRLNDLLRRYIGTELSVGARRVVTDGKLFVVITIPACTTTLAFSHDEHPEAALHPGRVYVRNEAAQSVEVRDATTMAEIVERLADERSRLHIRSN